jgi:hypothetical protein
MRRAAGRQDEFTHFTRMVEGQKLRDPTTHGMPAHDCALETEVIENRDGIIS